MIFQNPEVCANNMPKSFRKFLPFSKWIIKIIIPIIVTKFFIIIIFMWSMTQKRIQCETLWQPWINVPFESLKVNRHPKKNVVEKKKYFQNSRCSVCLSLALLDQNALTFCPITSKENFYRNLFWIFHWQKLNSNILKQNRKKACERKSLWLSMPELVHNKYLYWPIAVEMEPVKMFKIHERCVPSIYRFIGDFNINCFFFNLCFQRLFPHLYFSTIKLQQSDRYQQFDNLITLN